MTVSHTACGRRQGRGPTGFRSHAKGNLPVVRYIKIAKIWYFRWTNGEGCPSPAALLTKTLTMRHTHIRTGRGVTYSSSSSGKGVWRYLIYKDVEQTSLTSLAYLKRTCQSVMRLIIHPKFIYYDTMPETRRSQSSWLAHQRSKIKGTWINRNYYTNIDRK